MLWGEPGEAYWSSRDVRFGDLAKHYGAGLFWRDGRPEDLYHGGRLGQWLDEFQRAGKPGEAAPGTAGFNFVYAPTVAWVAGSLAGGGYARFGAVWLGVSLAAWGAALLGLRCLVGWRWTDPVVWLWAITFPAAYYGLILGQNHTVTLVVVVGAGLLLKQGRDMAAGLVLASLFYKPQWGVFLAVMMGLWGHWRVAAGWAAGTVVWVCLSFAVAGTTLMSDWMGVLVGMETGQQNQVETLNQTWRGLIGTVAPGLPGRVATVAAGVIWAVGAGWLGWRHRGVPTAQRRVEDLWIASAYGVFAMPYVMHYDALMFVPLWLTAICARGSRPALWAVAGTVVAGWISINLWNMPVAFMAPIWTLLFAALLSNGQQPESVHDG